MSSIVRKSLPTQLLKKLRNYSKLEKDIKNTYKIKWDKESKELWRKKDSASKISVSNSKVSTEKKLHRACIKNKIE